MSSGGNGAQKMATSGYAGTVATTAAAAEWVQCDRCRKWRKLPLNINSSTLPDQWFCEMNRWDPKYANCNEPEEPEDGTVVNGAPRPQFPHRTEGIPIIIKAVAGGRKVSPSSSLPDPKRFKAATADDDGGHAHDARQDVTSALKGLTRTLQGTIELVANYSGVQEDEESLFSMLNDIVGRLERVSKAAAKPLPSDEEIVNCQIPFELLEHLETHDGRNHPSLYTERVLTGVMYEQKRVTEATEAYNKLLADLSEQDNPTTQQ